MKLYLITETDDEKHWVVANSEEEALTTLKESMGHELGDAITKEVPEEEWASIIIRNTDYDEDKPDDMPETWTINELFNKDQKYPEIVGSTMYE